MFCFSPTAMAGVVTSTAYHGVDVARQTRGQLPRSGALEKRHILANPAAGDKEQAAASKEYSGRTRAARRKMRFPNSYSSKRHQKSISGRTWAARRENDIPPQLLVCAPASAPSSVLFPFFFIILKGVFPSSTLRNGQIMSWLPLLYAGSHRKWKKNWARLTVHQLSTRTPRGWYHTHGYENGENITHMVRFQAVLVWAQFTIENVLTTAKNKSVSPRRVFLF